jgi:hypothetical protein
MKRHDIQEITSMLRRADDMIAEGKSQKDACSSLGISVMTFHRWRKLAAVAESPARIVPEEQDHGSDAENRSQIEDLKLENQRLRRIVGDLLLEKMKVQEALDKTKK